MWGWGAALMEEKYYASDKPITLKKKNLISVKRKTIHCIDFSKLQFAPEEYLINNGFKIVENETGCS